MRTDIFIAIVCVCAFCGAAFGAFLAGALAEAGRKDRRAGRE